MSRPILENLMKPNVSQMELWDKKVNERETVRNGKKKLWTTINITSRKEVDICTSLQRGISMSVFF